MIYSPLKSTKSSKFMGSKSGKYIHKKLVEINSPKRFLINQLRDNCQFLVSSMILQQTREPLPNSSKKRKMRKDSYIRIM